MKLRNKKTGEIANFAFVRAYGPIGDCSLAKLNEEWEDYEPKEPLIKDEKIRKAVRAWAEMNKIEEACIQKIIKEVRGFEDSWFQITGQDRNGCCWKIEIHASHSETVSNDYKENMATITELCGEEE